MPDVSIRATAVTAAPMDYKVPGSQEIAPKVVTASMDGTSTVAVWYPCLQLLDPAGNVMFSAISPTQIAAGASADVSWFPGGRRLILSSDITFVGARIENHAGQTITTGTHTDLVYDTVAFDTAGMANLGSDARILTVQTAGLYLVACSTIWQYNNAGKRISGIFQNSFYSAAGAAVASDSRMPVWAPFGGSGGGAPHSDNITIALLQASPGDFFASGVLQESGSSVVCNGLSSGSNQDNYLSAVLLGGS